MCTVIFEIPHQPHQAMRILAVRDEDPHRPWDPPGLWWPERPEVLGVRDRLAGGAWLAAQPYLGPSHLGQSHLSQSNSDQTHRDAELAVMLNRPESVAQTLPPDAPPLGSRGTLVLDALAGKTLPETPHTESFNLVHVTGSQVRVSRWDGHTLTHTHPRPGVHMLAHHEVDDPRSLRIKHWLPVFEQYEQADDAQWRNLWLQTLRESAQLPAADDRAIIRDNTPHGFPTQSLLVVVAEIWPAAAHVSDQVRLKSATFSVPALWQGEELASPASAFSTGSMG